MQQSNYDHIISEIKSLSLSDQLVVLEQTVALVRAKTGKASTHRSILELKGRGRDIWKKIDVNEYLEQERSSWNG
jgi:hypothetical protein